MEYKKGAALVVEVAWYQVNCEETLTDEISEKLFGRSAKAISELVINHHELYRKAVADLGRALIQLKIAELKSEAKDKQERG